MRDTEQVKGSMRSYTTTDLVGSLLSLHLLDGFLQLRTHWAPEPRVLSDALDVDAGRLIRVQHAVQKAHRLRKHSTQYRRYIWYLRLMNSAEGRGARDLIRDTGSLAARSEGRGWKAIRGSSRDGMEALLGA